MRYVECTISGFNQRVLKCHKYKQATRHSESEFAQPWQLLRQECDVVATSLVSHETFAVHMQTHFAEGFPAGDSTLTQWVDAGLAPIDRVSVILLCNDSEDDQS